MKKIILAFIFSAFLTVLTAGEIFACDCIIWTSENLQGLVEHGYKNSEAVFSGEVIQINQKPNTAFIKVKFRVEKSWKNASEKELMLTTAYSETCGYKFKVKEKYLVYAQGESDNLEASICSRTSILKSNKDVDFLDIMKSPEIMSAPK